MLFLLLFVLGTLAVPLAIDLSRHGRENILVRSGRDLLNYGLHFRPALRFFESIHLKVNRIADSETAMTLGTVACVFVTVYLFTKTVDVMALVTKVLVSH